MAGETNILDSIQMRQNDPNRGKSKLLSPAPVVKRFVTEILHAFANRKISFAELTRLDPKKVRQVAEMGYVKLANGRYQEAKQIFEVLTFIDHKNYFHHLALAGAYQKLKRSVDALFQYGETLKLAPKNINSLVNRGEIYLRNKNYRLAAEDFREAILLDKQGKNLFANRARSLVIAIKRSLERDKKMILQGSKKNQPSSLSARKKAISPLRLVTPLKK